ncbi:uncharacterized protein LOC114743325 [Neltuma alba]|uniref:uncharacterized protein LOC114743325 n=1 Tax=Neltuma alba TaxID=207710 RepID=UPI0010A59E9B|nr:uncharacterized protein LOC114743325 [Prosopis alba]
MMMKSPTHSRSEASYYDAYGFDLQEDFSQFLEEARKYEMTEAKVKSSSSVHPEGGRGGKREESADKEREKKSGKKKKSWKSSVISWWKAERKSKPTNKDISSEEPKGSCGKKQSHVSGPIYNTGKASNAKKQWRPHSGPLITSLFSKSSKKENHNEIPYVCLGQNQQPNSPQDFHIQNYGPLYIVS